MSANEKDYQQALLEAFQLVSDSSVRTSKYAYTLKATIVEVEESSLGIYKIKSGGNILHAYAQGATYKENDIVYVLVPDGEISERLQIIGAYAPSASMYLETETSDFYVPVSDNLFGAVSDVQLRSWVSEQKSVSLDLSSFGTIFKDYIENTSRRIKFTARVKTNIDRDHQMKGNYGLMLNLPFLETSTAGGDAQTAVWRTYVMDVSTMQGNPYAFDQYAKQDLYYEVPDTLEYDIFRTPYITAFVADFGYTSPRIDIDYDIFIKDIGLEIVDVLTEEDAQGYSLRVVASDGNYFLKGKYTQSKTLIPVLKAKGKTVNDLSKWDCYWFVEDTSIDTSSEDYLNIGGLGWKCLNKKTNIAYDANGQRSFQLVTSDYTYMVPATDVASTLRYKCVVTQDAIVVGGSAVLKNLNSNIAIDLLSATGSSYFVKDTGYATLIARIYYPEVTNVTNSVISLKTDWQRFDKNDNYLDNDFFEVVRHNDPVTITTATGTSRQVWETEIRYPCSKIDQLNTVRCTFSSVTTNNGTTVETNLGTAELVVAVSDEFTYGIVIDDGDVLYKYDADGDSPLVANYDGPVTSKVKSIQPISYRVYKADGTELNSIEYLYCNYRWSFPKNSMMTLTGYTTAQLKALEQDDNYYYISGWGKSNINYTIINTYNKKKNDNTIILNVEFAGSTLSSTVSPKFLKDGESGTNGTKYSGIITYGGYGYGERDTNNKLRKLQLVYVAGSGWRRYDIDSQTLVNIGSPQMAAQVYADGERITTASRYSVSWDLLDEPSTTTYASISNTCFKISNTGVLSVSKNWDTSTEVYTNVVRAVITVNDASTTNSKEVIYAYYPLEITRVAGTSYLTKIPTLDGGFDQVVYAADGTNPEYDSSNPFECVDSLYNDTSGYYSYAWDGCSNLRIPSGTTYQCKATPMSKFDNGNSRNYIRVMLTMSANQRAQINSLISNLNTQITNTSNLMAYYTNNKTHILDFVKKFDYNNYVSTLNGSKNVLNYRSQAIQIINNMYNIIEEINTYCTNSLISISDFNYTSYYSSCRSALNTAKSNMYNLIYAGGFSNLSSLSSSILTVQERIKTKYGVSIYTQLCALVDSWNSQITSNYQPLYVKLVAQTAGKYVLQAELDNLHTFSGNVIGLSTNTDLAYLTKTHDSNAPAQEFVNLQSQLSALANMFKSVDGELNSLSAIDKNVLKKINKLLEIYKNIDYQNNYYAGLASELTAQLNECTAERDGYNKALLPNSTNYIVHIKPIVMIYNRYELSHLNGWDGTKLYVDSTNNQYMFMPQMGAGTKENGAFTGVVMGVRKFNANSTQHIGLFGYSSGVQSFFLNARDGSAILGKSSAGQIIADPSQSKALLYSYNFWKPSVYGSDGKPTSYNKSYYNKAGMLIDLTTPEIRFGNGSFVVTSAGEATIAGGGTIAGWKINDTQIYSNVTAANGRLTLDSGATMTGTDDAGNKQYTYSYGKIYSHNHNSLNATTTGFYLAQDGLSLGNSIRVQSAEGGSLLVGRVNGSRCWTISGNSDNSYIGYNASSFDAGNLGDPSNYYINGSSQSVFVSTEGIRLGTKFAVDRDGNLVAKNIIARDGGSIGGWVIGKNELSANGITISSNGSIHSDNWWIEGNGSATFNRLYASQSGTIGGWTIGSDRLTGGNTTLQADGTIYCHTLYASNAGTIGGWTIGSNTLSGGGITLGSGGTILGAGFSLGSTGLVLTNPGGASMSWGDNFDVDTSGILRAKGAIIEGTITAYAGNIGGWTINSDGLSTGSFKISSDGNAGFDNLSAATLEIGGGGGHWSDVSAEIRDLWDKVTDVSQSVSNLLGIYEGKAKVDGAINLPTSVTVNGVSYSLGGYTSKAFTASGTCSITIS